MDSARVPCCICGQLRQTQSLLSGTFVLAMFSSKGDLNPKNGRKVLWGVVQSLLAVGLLIAGGLKPLQIISLRRHSPLYSLCCLRGLPLLRL
ncbi:hypothetical protein ADH76_13820 [Enterocloster clostridioformis]|nr:hypothetical protein A4V08_20835 [Lachnoclostridium sp. YL32]OXE69400.1 hypothetical protein ADH76_13820 [Enterocloster clostridioformis]